MGIDINSVKDMDMIGMKIIMGIDRRSNLKIIKSNNKLINPIRVAVIKERK